MNIHIRTYTYRHTLIHMQRFTSTRIHTYIHTHTHTYIDIYIYTYIRTYMHIYIPTYIDTYCKHTYICRYVHAYIRLYRHAYNAAASSTVRCTHIFVGLHHIGMAWWCTLLRNKWEAGVGIPTHESSQTNSATQQFKQHPVTQTVYVGIIASAIKASLASQWLQILAVGIPPVSVLPHKTSSLQ